MLTLLDASARLHRRELLSMGSLALGGLSLPSLFAARAAADPPASAVTGKAVIFLFQQGGPSQFATFDPKPEAPAGVRTVGGTIATAVPGLRFGVTMPQLARRADRLTFVRSFQTGNAAHNVRPRRRRRQGGLRHLPRRWLDLAVQHPPLWRAQVDPGGG
jgi:hypothetical protein